MDGWEHAFMRDYLATERAKYLDAFLKNVNWEAVEKRLLIAAVRCRRSEARPLLRAGACHVGTRRVARAPGRGFGGGPRRAVTNEGGGLAPGSKKGRLRPLAAPGRMLDASGGHPGHAGGEKIKRFRESA